MSTSIQRAAAGRLGFLDWTRGLAAVIMLQGHVFHSLTAKDQRESSAYVFSQFVGGIPPAIFLFLTGVTLGFLMHSSELKGLGAWQRIWKALRRAGYLLGLAFLFRLQMWVFALPNNPWTDLFRVDILNCMALAIGVLSLMAVFETRERIRHSAVLGVAIAAASPILSSLDWSGVPEVVRLYIAPDYLAFGFFPWASFVAFGVCAGSILRLARRDDFARIVQWGALFGVGLIVAGRYFSNLPYSLYARSEFWLDSPALVLIKLGVILVLVAFAFLWSEYASRGSWSWVKQLGTTSLLVYWVHTELVYGRWFWMWKENLDIAQTASLAVFVILLMVGLSTLRTRWSQVRAWVQRLEYSPSRLSSASGD